MSLSIMTNTGAMTALRTLQGTNYKLSLTQDRISTGLKIASARDNAAVWSISSEFRMDIASTRTVADGLGVALSTVSLARGTAERVAEMLDTIQSKALVRAGMQANGDPNAAVVSREIGALSESIDTVMSNATFNGTNLLTAAETGDGSGGTGAQELWYYFRWKDPGGTILSEEWKRYDATTQEWQAAGPGPGDLAATDMGTLIPEEDLGLGKRNEGFAAFDGTNWVAHSTGLGGQTWTANDNPFGVDIDWNGAVNWPPVNAAGAVTLAPASAGAGTGVASDASFVTDASGTIFTVANANLNINITAGSSFDDIEAALTAARQAAANLGAAEQRLEVQRDFSRAYGMALERGLGAMVDADMTEESARYQALQVQQKLGAQSATIANTAPQILLQLFR